jgi:arabinofuranosyltransferase
VPSVIVTDGIMIGLAGFVAGRAVHIADPFGLADPIASRVRMVTRIRPGHEKSRPRDWLVARYVDPASLAAATERYPGTPAARAALACGDLAELVDAITQPLTWRRILRNVVVALRLTRLRFSDEPASARAQLCGSS